MQAALPQSYSSPRQTCTALMQATPEQFYVKKEKLKIYLKIISLIYQARKAELKEQTVMLRIKE